MKNLYSINRLALAFLCISSAIVSGESSSNITQINTPAIYFENTTQNFGTIYQGQKTSKVFSFSNKGGKPLIIEKIESSCGCTAAASSSSQILPGDFGEIKVTFDSTGRLGNQSKLIYVRSNDPNESVSKLTIQGFIKTALHISPSNLNFSYVQKDSAPSMTVLIRPEEGVDILRIESDSEYLLTELKKNESDWKLIVSVAAKAPVGTIRAKLLVHTTSKDQPQSIIAVYARVVGEITAAPENIIFVYSKSTQQLSFNPQALQVLSIGNKPFKITNLDCQPDMLSFRQTFNSTSTKYSIVTAVKKDYEKIGANNGNIYIHTDNPEQEIITVPFKIITR